MPTFTDTDIVGLDEIRRIEKVAFSTAYRWSLRDDFPKPRGHPVHGKLTWIVGDIKAWRKAARKQQRSERARQRALSDG